MFCTKCGRKLDDGLKFCEGCGAPVDPTAARAAGSATSAATTNAAGASAKKSGTGVGKIIIIVAVIMAVVWFITDGDDSSSKSSSASTAATTSTSQASTSSDAAATISDDTTTSSTDAAKTATATTGSSALASASVGDLVEFGSYYQTSWTSKDPITWRVLAVDGDNLLLMSEYVIAGNNEMLAEIGYGSSAQLDFSSWGNSPVHSWLNSYFLNDAFTSQEQAMLDDITIDGLSDKVALFSGAEYVRYAKSSWGIALATPYCLDNSEEDPYAINWWLRDEGTDQDSFQGVYDDGSVNVKGFAGIEGSIGARPIVWVNTKASPVEYLATSSGKFEQA